MEVTFIPYPKNQKEKQGLSTEFLYNSKNNTDAYKKRRGKDPVGKGKKTSMQMTVHVGNYTMSGSERKNWRPDPSCLRRKPAK